MFHIETEDEENSCWFSVQHVNVTSQILELLITHVGRIEAELSFLLHVNIQGASVGFNNWKHVFTCWTLKQRMRKLHAGLV